MIVRTSEFRFVNDEQGTNVAILSDDAQTASVMMRGVYMAINLSERGNRKLEIELSPSEISKLYLFLKNNHF